MKKSRNMRTAWSVSLLCAILSVVAVQAMERTPSPPGAEVYIMSPKNGATVESPVKVVMGVKGMKIMPAGTDQPGTGHHHILIDTRMPPQDKPIPSDDHHKHFGKGQTEAMLDLPPGKHTLQLLLGDKGHVPHNPVVASEPVTITVK